MLEFSAGMMCLGCFPDWQWEKFVPLNITYENDADFFNFDAEKAIKYLTGAFEATKFEKNIQKRGLNFPRKVVMNPAYR